MLLGSCVVNFCIAGGLVPDIFCNKVLSSSVVYVCSGSVSALPVQGRDIESCQGTFKYYFLELSSLTSLLHSYKSHYIPLVLWSSVKISYPSRKFHIQVGSFISRKEVSYPGRKFHIQVGSFIFR
jgi:hypothetical protein